MSLLIIPGREAEFEGAEWWQVRSVVRADAFKGTNTEPLIVMAQSPTGERDQWVLKPIGRLGEVRSIRELVGHRFAKALGIPVIEAGVIAIGEDLLRAAPRLRDLLGGTAGPSFGSRFKPGLTDLIQPERVPRDHRATATDIYGWDILSDNADRRLERSNVVAGDGAMYAIDHELTFSWFGAIGGPGPRWVHDILYRLVRCHFFCHQVPNWGCGFDGLERALTSLTQANLHELTADLPSRWLQGEGRPCVVQISEYLADVHSRAEQIIAAMAGRRLS